MKDNWDSRFKSPWISMNLLFSVNLDNVLPKQVSLPGPPAIKIRLIRDFIVLNLLPYHGDILLTLSQITCFISVYKAKLTTDLLSTRQSQWSKIYVMFLSILMTLALGDNLSVMQLNKCWRPSFNSLNDM